MGVFRIFQWIAERRAKRYEEAWSRFEQARANAEMLGLRICQVVDIRQHARTGTKARVRWIGAGNLDAVWASNLRLNRGQILVVSGNRGYGPHHNEPVFYIKDISHTITRETYHGWLQHEARRESDKETSHKQSAYSREQHNNEL